METYNPTPLSTQVQQVQTASDELSRQETKKSKTRKYFLLFIIIAFAAIGIFLISRGISGQNADATPTPNVTSIVKSPTPKPSATPEAKKVDKSAITVSILNGTGIAKEASFLQAKLEPLDYKKIEAGNADSQDHTTTVVTFSKDLPESVTNEITDLLEGVYQKVEAKTLTSGTNKIEIITGLRTGQTLKPSATATATPKASATATSTPTATPTATPQGN